MLPQLPLRDALPLKRIRAGEKREIVEILHTAIEKAEDGERFQFFRNHSLSRIGAEHRRREIEQRRVLNLRRPRSNNISESNVELHGNARSRQSGVELDSHAFVVGVLLDSADLDYISVELDAVRVHIDFAHGPEELFNVAELIVGSSSEVNIHRGSRKREVARSSVES